MVSFNKTENIFLHAVTVVTLFTMLLYPKQHVQAMKTHLLDRDTLIIATGVVEDKVSNNFLPGVSIKIKGTQKGTFTDKDGKFSLPVPRHSILVISYLGYESREVEVGDKGLLGVIQLSISKSQLNEVVVTGYGSQRKKDLTGAVSVVDISEMNKQPTGQISAQLQGQAAGVTIIGSGQPGDEPQIRIRGINTFGNNKPLFVIDGVPTQNISDINPNDVASMQVLKDAGAASIYGSRASNGVVIITTKKGKSGKPQLSYDSYVGVQLPKNGNVWHILSSQEMAQLKFNALSNSGTPISATNADPLYGSGSTPVLPDYIMPTGASEGDAAVDPDLYYVNPNYTSSADYQTFYRITKANKKGTNWFDEIFNPTLNSSHNIAVKGGGEKSNYFLSFNYLNQQGTLIETYLKRYSVRSNSQFNITDHIRVGQNLEYSIVNNPRDSALTEGSAVGFSMREQPIIPVHDIKGNYGGSYGGQLGNAENPVALQERSVNNKTSISRLFGSAYLEVDLLKDLTARTTFGGESYSSHSRSFSYPTYENAENTQTNSYSESAYSGYNWTWTNTLNYHKIIRKHDLKLMLGTEAYDSKYQELGGTTTSYYSFDPDYTTLSSGSGTQTNYSTRSLSALMSQFGRLDYSFNDKYLLSATLRRDGSSVFVNHQYGWFPAGSIAWRMTEEQFMKNISWLNDLKVRGSYGIMGNQLNVSSNNGYYTYASSKSSSYYDIGGTNTTLTEGFQVDQVGAPDAKWEKNYNLNIGIDASFLKGDLALTVDYYQKNVKDLLYNPSLPGTYGTGTPPYVNIAAVKNSGIDLTLSVHKSIIKGLELNSTITLTTINNRITHVTDNTDYFYSGGQRRFGVYFIRNQVGHSIGEFYGYKVAGFFNTEEEIAGYNSLAQQSTGSSDAVYEANAGVGRFRFEDVNKDNQITDDDRTFLGNPNPKFNYGVNIGLTYKQFDFSIFLYGVYGNKIWNNVRWWTDFYPSFAGAKSYTALYDSWTPTHTNAKAPIQENSGVSSTNGSPSSYFIENGSYLRAKNMLIGYTFQKTILDRVGIESLRIYLQTANLFTFTKYTGTDPEISGNGVTEFGVDEGAYPNSRQFLLGVNLKF
ncbi:TonB-dependent receptor [Chitinophaga sp.]|uniref:SusC/RagA family TonB-linked outer membrane protein n=1 Tax=Chitinophaga sp. TaxID=1869181 RepID=UPI0031D3D2D1